MTCEERLWTAVEIAREAGQMIVEARRGNRYTSRYKSGRELVTDADVAVDTLIGERLQAAFGDEERLSEELSPEHGDLDKKGPLWVIDPIDGTVNFAHGLRHVAVSIAWVLDGQTRLGVVHAPFLGETYTAVAGRGATCNELPIQASRTDTLDNCLVGTGFPYRREARATLLRRLTAVLEQCQDVRRNGSAALDLCDVACGRLDAFYESVSPWDMAAGWLIAREAGAQAGHLYPGPEGVPEDLQGENLLVTTPAVHKELRDLLRRADAGSSESS